MDLDLSDVEVLPTEEVVIEPSLIRPDYVFKIGDVIFMMEFESSHVGTSKKKLFKLYVAAYDYRNNDDTIGNINYLSNATLSKTLLIFKILFAIVIPN